MLTKLGCYIKDLISDVKRKLIANKLIFYVALAALAIGTLIALSKDYSDCDNTNNFIFVICSGDSSPIPQILRIILWIPLIYLCAYLSSVHFVAFTVVGFGGVALGSYFLMRNAFVAVAVDAVTGLIYLFLYAIPMLILTFVCFVCVMQDVNVLVDFSRNRKHVTSIRCNHNALWNIIKPFILFNLLIALAYWLIFYLILLLFC